MISDLSCLIDSLGLPVSITQLAAPSCKQSVFGGSGLDFQFDLTCIHGLSITDASVHSLELFLLARMFHA